jgi:hypothetical protein
MLSAPSTWRALPAAASVVAISTMPLFAAHKDSGTSPLRLTRTIGFAAGW